MTGLRAAAVGLLLAGAACAHARAVPATAVRGGSQCGSAATEPSARWLASEDELRKVLGPEGPLGGPMAPAGLDFSRQGVVLVGMGRRPTAGYGLSLASPSAEVKDGVATVKVRFEEPAPGTMVAQVLTSPCLLVALPREGLREVRVVDASGAVRAVATVGQ